MARLPDSRFNAAGLLTEAGAMALLGELSRAHPAVGGRAVVNDHGYGIADAQGPDGQWLAVLRPGDAGEVTLVRSLREAARTLATPVDERTVAIRTMARLARSVGFVSYATPYGVLVRGVTDAWEIYPSEGHALDRALGLDPESLLGPVLP